MDYQKIYIKLTSKKDRDLPIKERHHIIPKSIGGDDSPENLVDLTPREHYLAHKLLVKITKGEDRKKMAFALWRMTVSGRVKTNSREYESARKTFVENMSEFRTGKKFGKHSDEARKKASARSVGEKNNMFGKNHTTESKEKISKNRSGKLVGKDNHFFGKTHSEESRKIMGEKSSKRQKGVPKQKYECHYCGGMFAPNMLDRWHNDNCKNKPVTLEEHMVCPNDRH